MYIYLSTQPQCYHCLFMSLWTIITVTLNDSSYFSVSKGQKCFLDSTWKLVLSWFWSFLHRTTCKITGMQLRNFLAKTSDRRSNVCSIDWKKTTWLDRPFLWYWWSPVSVTLLQTNHSENYERLIQMQLCAQSVPCSIFLLDRQCSLLPSNLSSSPVVSWYHDKDICVRMRYSSFITSSKVCLVSWVCLY